MKGKGRSVALASAAAGLIVLMATGFVLRRALIERWYIDRLMTGDQVSRTQAANTLAEMKSVRGFEAAFLVHARSAQEKDLRGVALPGGGIAGTVEWECAMLLFSRLMGDRGEEIKSFLIRCLADEDDRIRILAASFLSSFGRAAAPAGPALHAMLSDPKKAVRISAAMALVSIGDPSGETGRVLREAREGAAGTERMRYEAALRRLEELLLISTSPAPSPAARR
jgi:HEAT repeat protein